MSTVPTTGSSPHTHVILFAVLAVAVALALAIAAYVAVDDGSASTTGVPSATRSATTVQASPGSADALERRAAAFASDPSSFGGPDAAERWLIERAGP
jgi:hypothetical protein